MQKFDHNIGFRKKRRFFRRKLAKIAENSDHNMDPWLDTIKYILTVRGLDRIYVSAHIYLCIYKKLSKNRWVFFALKVSHIFCPDDCAITEPGF
jgi:hypothetical protein